MVSLDTEDATVLERAELSSETPEVRTHRETEEHKYVSVRREGTLWLSG